MATVFDGRIALVTGGAGAIGASVARRLAMAGALVAVADLDLEDAKSIADDISSAGGRAAAYRVDVASGADVRQAIDEIESAHGLISMVVAAAGTLEVHDFVDLPEDTWDRTLAVNLKGTFLVFQEVSKRLLSQQGAGSLVAISSIAGRSGRSNIVDYAASKAGVISLVRSAALVLGPRGITVNAVCPGIVDTAMTHEIHKARSKLTGSTPDESLNNMVETIPLGRIQLPDDVADVVHFLLSPEGSYIHGQALNACGGLEMS